MFTKANINEIIKLENQYKEKKKNLVSGDYDAKIKLLLDHSQRRAIEQILKQEKYQSV